MALLLDNGADLDEKDNYDRSALSYAAESSSQISAAAAKLMLILGADFNTIDLEGNTP